MALTKVLTGGIADDAITSAKIPANAITDSELKLDDTKKTMLANAFSEYASNVSKLNDKLSAKSSKMTEKEISKMTFEKMAQFTKLRDAKIMDVLNDKLVI